MAAYQPVIVASCVATSFVLAGNAVTQSFMTIPALIVDFPSPDKSPTEHSARANLLGRQWPLCWNVGNNLFRPISTLSTLGYAFSSYAAAQMGGRGDWRFFAVSALLGLATIVHSAVNMQPLNDRLTALAGLDSSGKEKVGKEGVDGRDAEELARRWGRGNVLRLVLPMIGGVLAMSQLVR